MTGVYVFYGAVGEGADRADHPPVRHGLHDDGDRLCLAVRARLLSTSAPGTRVFDTTATMGGRARFRARRDRELARALCSCVVRAWLILWTTRPSEVSDFRYHTYLGSSLTLA